ncbi:hypothetical protein INQ51_18465 [Maribellus sp. CM-23]|uniref:hypothetical protein n=1 Tax=Maribellus sp. CM-23 TaxID=2781026 RepID=UPI001F2F409D|nr:hypothetical protein [Maribellus sp. CM-23]MCE4566311.1 hypothetical protein [Maribellus sp. CM-23]
MRRYFRNTIFVVTSVLFYLLWNSGGEEVYAKFLKEGVQHFTTKISAIETVYLKQEETKDKIIICFKYPDRTTKMTLDYCMPIVLLFAWQFSLLFDSRITKKTALKFFAINFLIVFILQFLFPLLLFDISNSKVKSVGLYIGFQIFGFIIFFLILKDSILIRLKAQQQKYNSVEN